jgi:hypothetical protein
MANAKIPEPLVVNDPVSLVDIVPTILDLLHLDLKENFDGLSLMTLLRRTSAPNGEFSERIRFTESEYNPQGFTPGRMTPSVLAAAAKIYRLDSGTDRITVRSELIDSILSSRQYAALLGDRLMAAAIPDEAGDGRYELIYMPIPAGAPEQPQDRPRLREALQQRFGIRFGDVGALSTAR